MTDTYTFGAPPGASVKFVGAGMAMTAASLFLLVVGPERPVGSGVARIVGAIGVAFVLAATFLILRRARDQRPPLTLSDQGIVDHSSATAVGPIGWREILGLRLGTVQRQEMIVVDLHDPDSVIARGGPLAKTAMRANLRMFGSAVFIPTSYVDDVERFLDLAEKYTTVER